MRDQRGSAVVEHLLLIPLSLLVVVLVVNLGAWVIEAQIVHSAADQGVRAGARQGVDPSSACHDRAAQVLGNLLNGPEGAGATLACSADAEEVTAEVSLPLRSWLPGIPDSSTHVRANARLEGFR